MSDLLLLTNNEYDKAKYQSAGAVMATHIEAISGARAFGADIMGLFGNKSELLTKKMDDALQGVNAGLLTLAKSRYPNLVGICDLRYSSDNFSTDDNNTFISFHVAGTALVPKASAGGGLAFRKTRRNRH